DGENDDGDLGPFPQLPANFNAIHIWQAQIKDDQVRFTCRSQGQAFFAAAGGCDLKLFFSKNSANGALNLRFIVNDKNMGCVVHSSASGKTSRMLEGLNEVFLRKPPGRCIPYVIPPPYPWEAG